MSNQVDLMRNACTGADENEPTSLDRTRSGGTVPRAFLMTAVEAVADLAQVDCFAEVTFAHNGGQGEAGIDGLLLLLHEIL